MESQKVTTKNSLTTKEESAPFAEAEEPTPSTSIIVTNLALIVRLYVVFFVVSVMAVSLLLAKMMLKS